jgi:hypothetical protein
VLGDGWICCFAQEIPCCALPAASYPLISASS